MKYNKIEKIIAALLASPTIKQAAKKLNMSESTLYNYLKEDEFREKYNSAKTAILNQTAGYIQENMAIAAENIINIINDETIPPQTRLNASKTIIEYGIKFTEIADILPRLEALEEQTKQNL